MNFLPISLADLQKRGWKALDVILITGDAYVDHPSFGAAVIGRVLESNGFRVGIIAQPDCRTVDAFKVLGRPRLFVGITSGNVDSMVANYTANKRPRKIDDYSPVGKTRCRPDRAVIVYANRVREAFKDVPIVLGGIEASMRRLAHYDYWDNSVRRSILLDARGDILVFGMGETQIVEIARHIQNGTTICELNNISGTVVVRKSYNFLQECAVIPSYEEVKENKNKFNQAFRIIYSQQNPFTAKPVVQKHGDRFVIQFPPLLPLNSDNLDRIHELPFMRKAHPVYDSKGGIKALETVKFSIISHRGCSGTCSFCSLSVHQGRIVQSRSPESIIREASLLAKREDFRGTIPDVGGPTANLYAASCRKWNKQGWCADRDCLGSEKCRNLQTNYKKCLALYRSLRKLPGIKHVFVGSGFRYDLLIDESDDEYLQELCQYHISGQMKVAPEHTVDSVLKSMNKPSLKVYETFVRKFNSVNNKLQRKCYLVNYFLSAHPGATLQDAASLSLYLINRNLHPEQVQDFIPLPMTIASCMYYTEVHPLTGKKIYVPKKFTEKKMQRALLQYRNPSNRKFISQALREMNPPAAVRNIYRKFLSGNGIHQKCCEAVSTSEEGKWEG